MRNLKDLDKHKIWLYDQFFFIDNDQLKVINTKGVKEEHAYDFINTGKKSDHIKRCEELAAKERPASPVADKKQEQMIEAAIEKAMDKLLADYDLVKKK